MRGIYHEHIDYDLGAWHICVHMYPQVHTHTHTHRFIFPQFCWTTSSSTIWPGNTVIYKPFRNPAGFMPNWIISSCTWCQFLEINNRPLHFGLWSHQLSQDIFPDVSVLGCYYKKTQHKLSQAKLACSRGWGMCSSPNNLVLGHIRLRKREKPKL